MIVYVFCSELDIVMVAAEEWAGLWQRFLVDTKEAKHWQLTAVIEIVGVNVEEY